MISVQPHEEAPSLAQDRSAIMDDDAEHMVQQVQAAAGESTASVLPAPDSQATRAEDRSLMNTSWVAQDPASVSPYNYHDQRMVAPYVGRDPPSLPATNWLPYTNGMDWDFDFYMTQALNNFSPIMGMHQSTIWSPTSGNPLDNNNINTNTSPEGGSKGSVAEESPAVSITNSATSSKRHGTFYADGEVSRLARHRNAEISHIGIMGNGLDFSPIETEPLNTETSFRPIIPHHTYNRILERFDDLCMTENLVLFFERFRSDRFPSRQALETCIESYFENTSTIFQVVHQATATLEGESDWILCLALAAMGAATSSSVPLVTNAEALRTFLQRAIITRNMFVERTRSVPELSFMQACIIYDVLELHLQHNINEEALAGTRSFSDHCTNVKRSRWLNLHEPLWDDTWTEENWKAWAHRESQRRVAYCAWQLDSWYFLTSGKNLSANFSLGDVQTNLPVHEALWVATSLGEWMNLKATHKQPMGLTPLLTSIYQQQPLSQELGDFAQTIAVHAVCRRTMEVGSHILDPLAGLDAGQQQRGESVRDIYWLPSDPEYQKWRNKALDCLDTLHWGTHGVIARLQGLEPPAVLHLHLSRLVLLVPYQDVYDLMSEVVSSHGNSSSFAHGGNSRSRREDLVAKIWLWISKDHYKSRLAIVHAGAMFWYIRHHGTGNILEPTSLFMSSVILWAYGSFVPLLQASTDEHHPATSRVDTDEEYDPKMIQIDRPCDDELIQIFIRRGNSMQPHMLGVGNICQPGGALGVLKVGARLIKNRCSAWPISKTYENLLLHCAQVSARTS
ncbi:unnamed protein product [Aureobasidium uvarum]|uniref:Xylanolytic transcriptional activator regulatory domain-containing protein n=1 Tax=Aureobasidium uvarum TaxID=2773716 RepID=A0A9N8KGV1_9PEZI|nr:unnamed protein product [Aureobasidium uvarum]